jgi:menaquinone-specific isochorismate synthase
MDSVPDFAWLRKGEGFVGFGRRAVFSAPTLGEAGALWHSYLNSCETSARPELAFVSGVFDSGNTSALACIVVPERVEKICVDDLGSAGCAALGGAAVLGDPQTRPASGRVAPLSPATVAASAVSVPSKERWICAVERALGALQNEELAKVVLARSLELELDVDVLGLLHFLASRYQRCWTFRVGDMVGASPEMLIRLEGGLATSRVLAGTIPREPGAEERLAHWLADDDKNVHEHEFARDSVALALAPYCEAMNVPDTPSVLSLPNVLHLATDITGRVRPGVDLLELAVALHPSAAVCGTPTAAARALIAELEGFDRGHYAAPVGWIDADGNGELAIALRCGAVGDGKLTLYAGCGIVSQSDPLAEYAETQAKFAPMLEALGALK